MPAQGWPVHSYSASFGPVFKTVMSQKKAMDYSAKHPGMPVSYLLELNSTSPDAVWRVFWGESAGTSEFSGVVDATTGQFVESLT